MINSKDIPNYNLTDEQLEEHILFWIAVSGKIAMVIAPRLQHILECNHKLLGINDWRPFEVIRQIRNLAIELKQHGIGNHTLKSRAMKEIAYSNLNLRTCTTDELEEIIGIGMKTSRGFIMHTRSNIKNLACLDVHSMSELRENGFPNAPRQPSRSNYKYWEEKWLEHCKKIGKDPVQWDLENWNNRHIKVKTTYKT